jgi:hypothetical protein
MSSFVANYRYLKPLHVCECTGKWLQLARKWDIVYGVFLHNHLAHNLVVMGCIGSSEVDANKRMEVFNIFGINIVMIILYQWWYSVYSNHSSSESWKLQAARSQTDDMPTICGSNWLGFISNDDHLYPSYLTYFDGLFETSNPGLVVRTHLPHVLSGLVGSALHPIIHLGFALEAQNTSMMAEGLACLCCFHQPLISDDLPADRLWNESHRNHSVIDKSIEFLQCAASADLHRIAVTASCTDEYMAINIGQFQRKIRAFNDLRYPLHTAMNGAGTVELPALNSSLEPVITEATTLIAAAYLASDCEFFIIHCLTSLHGLLAVLPYLNEEQQRQALACWWRGAMATIVVQNIPNLGKLVEYLNEWKRADIIDGESGGTSSSSRGCVTEDMGDAVKGAVWWMEKLDIALTSTDEHAPKAVYAMWRWSEMDFIPPHSKMLFEQAALNQIRPNEKGGPEKNIWFSS